MDTHLKSRHSERSEESSTLTWANKILRFALDDGVEVCCDDGVEVYCDDGVEVRCDDGVEVCCDDGVVMCEDDRVLICENNGGNDLRRKN